MRRRILALAPVLRLREFRLLFCGQSISVAGDSLFPVALAFAVLDELEGTASQLGLVLAAQGIPLTVLVLVAGVYADRLPRRAVMVVSDVGRCLCQAALAVLLLTGTAELWHVVGLVAIYGAFEAFFRPAAGAMVAQLVPPEELQKANGVMGLSLHAGYVLGPVAAGALLLTVGAGAAIAIDAFTFVASAACLLAMRVAPSTTEPAREPVEQHFWRDLRGGVEEVLRRPWLRDAMIVYSLYSLIVLPAVLGLGPVYADRELDGAASWAAAVAAWGAGAALGSVVALRHEPGRPMLAALGCMVFASLQPLIVALSGSTVAMAAMMGVAGIATSYGWTLYETSYGRAIPQRALSRVVSLDYFSTVGFMPLGYALAGPLADAAGLVATMVAAGVVVATLCAAAAVRELRSPTPYESVAS